MRTYYIVEQRDCEGGVCWLAHKRGLWTTFNSFNPFNEIWATVSWRGPDDCEQKLHKVVAAKKITPKVVRVVRI